MLDVILGACGLAFLACSFYILLLNRTQREVVLERLHLRRRRATNSLTPPRSLSPEKQESALDKPSPTPDYSDVFPPSRRHVLAELPADALNGPGESARELGAKDADYLKRVPSCEATDTEDLLHHTTPTGFTVSEVKRLGDFPDYAALSGVPLPEPYHAFDISKALPRPYRPFRWAYHQTMSLTKLEPDWWLELEHTYADRIRQREQLFEEFSPLMLQALPGSELATKELMEMSLQFLCARYPQHFRLDLEEMVFHNTILQTEADLRTMDPLHVLLHNIPEDFAIMLRDPETGIYSFRAGIICSSLGWNLGSKIGLKLHEIHAPIPDYKEKMQFSMDRYFSKKPTEKAIQRGSWGLEIDEPLFMPPEDPHEKLREVQDPTHTIDRCHLRVDWQTLRRLPLSGAVVFNFKAVFTPVTEFRDEPYVPALILKVLKDGKKNLMEYKNTWHTEHVVIPALEEYQREQVAKGLVEEDWEPHTLEESPFYPGWEEKWHRRQGF
ncbi:hypothetical protein LTR91_012660 [Friedmanniomyces endolithicus]|uniref:Alpha-1,2-mannosyltransferase n=1 Tax=Friedmanniomyces endolithicus TaxID=329885 RepID=A0A4U0UHG7_9PEZI|nr:hypothetical protein LTS09_006472 [Friedmanniomyces endolithicus]KAK0792657.1 hypothetical protein LTR59_008467 [Friedmanniomyces endolithicus]KAK0794650.1 hypothetical protein LTR38_009147 [Friedmanniomyces endolithicus]KAK0801981.1 hypothetical protein LTR75_008451 [Friedmanniomyces endolithicus]KAK0840514.1 hypothetical protein LTR03_010533 [Friedmanniomyces endolithicus]